jgi:hypothetical protein
MDIYEFTLGLWRQRRLLVIGFVVLFIAILLALFEVGSDGIRSRITPKYQASIDLVVVPAELESLTSASVSSGSPGAAELYGELLMSLEAERQIEETHGIDLLNPLEVRVATRSPFIRVTATTDSPDGAVEGVLGAFRWLESRLAEPPVLANIPVAEPSEEPTILDEEGKFLGVVRLEVDRSYALVGSDLAIVVSNFRGDEFAVPLSEAARELGTRTSYVRPESELIISLEREVGRALDSITVTIPPLPDELGPEPPTFVLTVERGAVAGTEENPRLLADRMGVRWEATLGSLTTEELETRPMSVLLITQEPIVTLAGQRRTPIIALGMLGAGILLLLVSATTIDTWQQARLERGKHRVSEPDYESDEKRNGDLSEVDQPVHLEERKDLEERRWA